MTEAKFAVITVRDDGHIPFVEKHMDSPFVVIDPARIIGGAPLSYSFKDGDAEVLFEGQSLSNIKSIWYRRPEWALRSLKMGDKEQEDFVKHSLSRFMRLFYGAFPNALWLSDFYKIYWASDKMRQLKAAHDLGFNIPDTLVTSNPLEAKNFVTRYKEVIVKPVEVKVFKRDGESRMMFARKVDTDEEFVGLNLAPAIIQQAIAVSEDIRVTVVRKKVFAASAKPKSAHITHPEIRDWRLGDEYGGTKIDAFDLPKKIEELCIAHVEAMGLEYGAIDLVLDKKGKFWFLENNPNGQWAFVEEVTGQPIGKAIADLLVSGDK